MMVATHIKNETSNWKAYAGIEDVPGRPAVPTFPLTGALSIERSSALNRQSENTGGYDRNVTASRQPATFTGSYPERLTFETLPQHMRLLIKAGASGASLSGDAYQYTKAPSFDQDDIETMTVQYGVPGLGFQSTGVRMSQATITIDADASEGSWQLGSSLFVRDKRPLPGDFDGVATGGSSDGLTMESAAWEPDEWVGAWVYLHPDTPVAQVRQVTSNTADTLTVSTAWEETPSSGDTFHLAGLFATGVSTGVENEVIPTYGTQFYLDTYGNLGETQVRGRLISTNVELNNNLSPKRFLEDSVDEVSPRVGRGDREVSGSFRVEFDQWYEYNKWRNTENLAIRIEQYGSMLSGDVRKRARIDVPRLQLDTVSEDTRESNITATFGWVAYLPTDDPIITVDTINGLAQLP